jgi:hypothetical protein
MGEITNARKVLIGISEEKKPHEDLGVDVDGNIKMDVKEILRGGVVDWFYLG